VWLGKETKDSADAPAFIKFLAEVEKEHWSRDNMRNFG
jgi:hypothetical protein